MSRLLTNKEKLEKIKSLKAEVLEMEYQRVQEIGKLLGKAEGLFIDNELLVGFIKYVKDDDKRDSKFLSEIYKLGKEILPSKKSRITPKGKKSGAGTVQNENVIQKGAVNG